MPEAAVSLEESLRELACLPKASTATVLRYYSRLHSTEGGSEVAARITRSVQLASYILSKLEGHRFKTLCAELKNLPLEEILRYFFEGSDQEIPAEALSEPHWYEAAAALEFTNPNAALYCCLNALVMPMHTPDGYFEVLHRTVALAAHCLCKISEPQAAAYIVEWVFGVPHQSFDLSTLRTQLDKRRLASESSGKAVTLDTITFCLSALLDGLRDCCRYEDGFQLLNAWFSEEDPPQITPEVMRARFTDVDRDIQARFRSAAGKLLQYTGGNKPDETTESMPVWELMSELARCIGRFEQRDTELRVPMQRSPAGIEELLTLVRMQRWRSISDASWGNDRFIYLRNLDFFLELPPDFVEGVDAMHATMERGRRLLMVIDGAPDLIMQVACEYAWGFLQGDREGFILGIYLLTGIMGLPPDAMADPHSMRVALGDQLPKLSLKTRLEWATVCVACLGASYRYPDSPLPDANGVSREILALVHGDFKWLTVPTRVDFITTLNFVRQWLMVGAPHDGDFPVELTDVFVNWCVRVVRHPRLRNADRLLLSNQTENCRQLLIEAADLFCAQTKDPEKAKALASKIIVWNSELRQRSSLEELLIGQWESIDNEGGSDPSLQSPF